MGQAANKQASDAEKIITALWWGSTDETAPESDTYIQYIRYFNFRNYRITNFQKSDDDEIWIVSYELTREAETGENIRVRLIRLSHIEAAFQYLSSHVHDINQRTYTSDTVNPSPANVKTQMEKVVQLYEDRNLIKDLVDLFGDIEDKASPEITNASERERYFTEVSNNINKLEKFEHDRWIDVYKLLIHEDQYINTLDLRWKEKFNEIFDVRQKTYYEGVHSLTRHTDIVNNLEQKLCDKFGDNFRSTVYTGSENGERLRNTCRDGTLEVINLDERDREEERRAEEERLERLRAAEAEAARVIRTNLDEMNGIIARRNGYTTGAKARLDTFNEKKTTLEARKQRFQSSGKDDIVSRIEGKIDTINVKIEKIKNSDPQDNKKFSYLQKKRAFRNVGQQLGDKKTDLEQQLRNLGIDLTCVPAENENDASLSPPHTLRWLGGDDVLTDQTLVDDICEAMENADTTWTEYLEM